MEFRVGRTEIQLLFCCWLSFNYFLSIIIRYSRGNRSLADNMASSLDKNNSQQIVTMVTGDEDEEYDIPDEIEDILGILVLFLYIHVHEIMSPPLPIPGETYCFYLSVCLCITKVCTHKTFHACLLPYEDLYGSLIKPFVKELLFVITQNILLNKFMYLPGLSIIFKCTSTSLFPGSTFY